MKRDARLFDLIQILRDGKLHTAAELARALGVSPRTIWRDMAVMAETGLQPGDLRRLAADRSDDLAAALLDFVCAADARLEEFAARAGWQPEKVAYARAALENGQIR